ncbi:Protein of unknown function [Gryllus bimaculatus]|nr:Protein of unknown function [Gryllus bimaculatus]
MEEEPNMLGSRLKLPDIFELLDLSEILDAGLRETYIQFWDLLNHKQLLRKKKIDKRNPEDQWIKTGMNQERVYSPTSHAICNADCPSNKIYDCFVYFSVVRRSKMITVSKKSFVGKEDSQEFSDLKLDSLGHSWLSCLSFVCRVLLTPDQRNPQDIALSSCDVLSKTITSEAAGIDIRAATLYLGLLQLNCKGGSTRSIGEVTCINLESNNLAGDPTGPGGKGQEARARRQGPGGKGQEARAGGPRGLTVIDSASNTELLIMRDLNEHIDNEEYGVMGKMEETNKR